MINRLNIRISAEGYRRFSPTSCISNSGLSAKIKIITFFVATANSFAFRKLANEFLQ